jgi:hypothetical protein
MSVSDPKEIAKRHTMARYLAEMTNPRDGPLSYLRAKAPFYLGVQFALGIAQMFMAVFSVVVLLDTGLSRFTFLSAGFTTLLTMTSILLFRGQRRK